MAFEPKVMSEPEIEAFLRNSRFAIVGTNRRDGPPQLTPVWYLHEHGRFYFSMYAKCAKYHNLSRDPRIALCITGHCPDARSVMVYGTAELHLKGGEDWIHDIERKIASRYYDSDEEARAYYESDDEQAAVLVVVTPTRILAEDYNS